MNSITFAQIDALIFEYGSPMLIRCEDGEGYYWQFKEIEFPVADSLGELFLSALQMGLA